MEEKIPERIQLCYDMLELAEAIEESEEEKEE